MSADADVVVIGAGLAGLVTACEVAGSGRRVVVLDQEHPDALGGQAWWSFGGLFLVGSAEQRRVGVHDSAELAWADWLGSAAFDPAAAHGQGPDRHGYAWAQHFVEFAAGGMRSWLHGLGVRWFPLVQWAERGGYPAGGPGVAHGNSVPRFHVTWGTGPAILAPFVARAKALRDAGLLEIRFRHRVTSLVVTGGRVTGVRAEVLASDADRAHLPFGGRGAPSSRTVVDDVELSAGAVVVASGGIGANHALARERWDPAAGALPARMLQGVPDSTDGLMLAHAAAAGAALVHEDRMWHYRSRNLSDSLFLLRWPLPRGSGADVVSTGVSGLRGTARRP